MGKLSQYIRKHERPFSVVVPNGKGQVQIQFYEGYVTIRSMQPGVRKFVQEIHITRKAWYKLLNSNLVNISRYMEGPSFDRYRAERRYYEEEAEQLEALRAQKAERHGRRRRARRRRT